MMGLSAHRSKSVQDWQVAREIDTIDWPTCSIQQSLQYFHGTQKYDWAGLERSQCESEQLPY